MQVTTLVENNQANGAFPYRRIFTFAENYFRKS